MLRFLAGRLIGAMIVLLVMSLVIYLLIGLMPGDPIDLMFQADPTLTPEDLAQLRAVYGLDQPLLSRYAAWLGNALQGDFGFSRSYRQPVLDILAPRMVNTLWLMGISFVLSLAIAIPLGVLAAVRQNGPVDLGVNVVALAGYSVPVFLAGTVADLSLRRRPCLAASRRFRHRCGYAMGQGAVPGVAGRGADADGPGGDYPVHPRRDDRGVASGLCPHRASQGAVLSPRRHGSRIPQRHDSRGHHRCAGLWNPGFRRARGRDHVRLPGHGQADVRFDSGERLQRRASSASSSRRC